MAWVRQLPSGLWAATVRTGPGSADRITVTDRLKTVVENMAAEIKADVRRGDFVDPRLARITVGDWWERCKGAVHREKASRKRDESHWRVHVEPRWAEVPIGSILKPDVSTWVVDMQEAGVGAATVEGAVGVLRGLLDQAVEAGRLRSNPAHGIKKAPRNAHVDRVLDPAEDDLVVARAGELFGDRPDGQLFIELLLDTGMRWEEAAAIPPELIDTRRRRIHIAWVMERDGTARPYAKSDAGNRTVAYGEQLASRLSAAKLAAPVVAGVFPRGAKGAAAPDRLVFYSPGGGGVAGRKRGEPGPLRYTNWLARVWKPSLLAEPRTQGTKEPGTPGPARKPKGRPLLDDPQPTPHDARHTFGTRLADEGVPLHDLMALMGHADVRSAQRYMHSREERFDRARKALQRARDGGAANAERRSDNGS